MAEETGISRAEHTHNDLIACIDENPYHVLYLLQLAAQYELGVTREELAKTVALRVAAEKVPSIRDLIDAWTREPSLIDFANAVTTAELLHTDPKGV